MAWNLAPYTLIRTVSLVLKRIAVLVSDHSYAHKLTLVLTLNEKYALLSLHTLQTSPTRYPQTAPEMEEEMMVEVSTERST
jgi:hypothetical protein